MKAYFNVKAFTLIEMLVVIAIMAILASGAIIRFDLYMAHQRLDTEAYKINTLISSARVRSLKTESIHEIRFAPEATNAQTISIVDISDNTVIESFNVRDHEEEGRRNISVTSTEETIEINPRQIGFSDAVEITISSNRFGNDVKHYRIRFVPNATKIFFELVSDGNEISL